MTSVNDSRTPVNDPTTHGAHAHRRADDESGPLSVVVAGGHSAGHIEPALAVADAIRRLDPTAVVTALGTERGLDTTLIPARGYPLELIPPVPLPRRPNMALLKTPGRLAASIRAAGAVLERVGADAVVGFGGYVAVPAYVAARRRSIPIVVHEANARPGVANRLGARLTRDVFTASPSVQLPHATTVGVPMRPAIAHLDRMARRGTARQHFGLRPDLPTLLVTGGSQGAQAINNAMTAAAEQLTSGGVQVLHIAGPKNAIEVRTTTGGPYVVVPFVEQMELAYSAADFVLCRSGAMTVAELTAVGLPAAYVPLPLRGAEQRFNAVPVVRAGGGLLVDNAELSAEWIVSEVLPLMIDPVALDRMAQAAAGAGARDADITVAREVLRLAAAKRHNQSTSPRRK